MSLLFTPRALVLAAIRGYQRVISPHKGFVCAYRVHTGRCSCSELGYRAIRRFGVGKGWLVLRERTARCGVAHRRHTAVRPRPPARERGDCACDLPCDLDLAPSPGKLDVCDLFSCCDPGGCDWPDRKNRRREVRHVHIPPYADRRDRRRASSVRATPG